MTHKDFAIQIAKEAGEIIKQNFTFGMKKDWKSDSNPVTETDYAVNKLLIEKVKKEFPKMGVLAEEESYKQTESDLWVCDPVDGTIPFSHNIPICTFAIARVVDGESVLGVVYDPFGDRLLIAEKGKGAYANGKKIAVNNATSVKNQALDFEVWTRAPYYNKFPDNLSDLIDKDGAMTFRFCSLIYASILVATGELVGVYFAGNTAHDVAAVKVIVEEAGGKVTDLETNEQRYDGEIKGAIISNGKIHNYLVEKMKIK